MHFNHWLWLYNKKTKGLQGRVKIQSQIRIGAIGLAVNTLPHFVGCSQLLTRTINCTCTSGDAYNVRKEEREERDSERIRQKDNARQPHAGARLLSSIMRAVRCLWRCVCDRRPFKATSFLLESQISIPAAGTSIGMS